MTTFITLTRLAAMLTVGTVIFGSIESANAASNNKARVATVRDHRGPNAAPSGGVTVDGRGWKVQPPARSRPTCATSRFCNRPPFGRDPPVVRDHRPKSVWPRPF